MARRSATHTGDGRPAARGRAVVNVLMDYETFIAELSAAARIESIHSRLIRRPRRQPSVLSSLSDYQDNHKVHYAHF